MADGANFESLNFEISVNTKEAAQGVRLLRNAVVGLGHALKEISGLNVNHLFAGISESAKQAAAEVKIAEQDIRRALDKLAAEAGIKDKVDASLAMQNTFWSFEQQTKWHDAIESARDWQTQMVAAYQSVQTAQQAFYDNPVNAADERMPFPTANVASAQAAIRQALSSFHQVTEATEKVGEEAGEKFWNGFANSAASGKNLKTISFGGKIDKEFESIRSRNEAINDAARERFQSRLQDDASYWAQQSIQGDLSKRNIPSGAGLVEWLRKSQREVADEASELGRIAADSIKQSLTREMIGKAYSFELFGKNSTSFINPDYEQGLRLAAARLYHSATAEIDNEAGEADTRVFQSLGDGISASFSRAVESTSTFTQVSKALSNITTVLTPALQAAGVSAEAFGNAMTAAAGPISTVVIAIQVAVKVATFLVDQFNEFNAAMKKVVDTAKALNEKYNPFVALKKELASLIALAKRQIMRRAINAVIKSVTEGLRSGIENLAEYDEQFSATMESFRNAMGLFKNSIGVAVAPIISYFIPAINALLSALTRAMNTLARLTALLTGQHTYTIAKDYQEIGESAGGASGKVKELQRTILGFDEINKLNGQNGSGSGGGGGAGDSINAYETLEVGEWPYDSWGAALLDFVKWLDGVGVPKLRAGFDKVSKFVNEFSRNLFDALTFDGVQDAISNLATHIGETLNNFLTGGENNGGLNWADMGKALGMAIQTAFNFAANFLLQLDFFALGKSLAEFINKAIEQIKPEDVANVLFTPIRAAFGLVVGFLADFDFPEFAQKAGAVVNNMITSLAKLIGAGTGDKHGGKWQSYFQIAVTNIANGIVALFDTIDWASLFDTLTTIVSSIIDGLELILNKLMQNKEFVNAVHRFVDFIINTAVRWFILKIKAVTGLAGNMSLGRMIGAALFGGGDSLIESGGNPLLDAFNLNPNDYIDGMEEATDATEDFSQAANIAALTTKNSMSSIDTASSQMAQQVDISGRNVVNAFRTMTTDSGKPLSDLSKNVNTNFTNAKNSITNNMESAKTAVTNNMASAKNAVTNNMNTAKTNAVNGAEALRSGVASKFNSVASDANAKFANMRDNIKGRIAEAKNGIPAFNDVGANIKNGVIAGMGDFKGQLNNWCYQFKDQILKNFKIKSPSRWARDMVGVNIGEGISLGLEESTSSVQKACEGLKEGISSELSGVDVLGNVRPTSGGADFATALGNQVLSAISTMDMNRNEQPIVCEVYLDRDRIASAVTRGQQAQNRRYSSTAMA